MVQDLSQKANEALEAFFSNNEKAARRLDLGDSYQMPDSRMVQIRKHCIWQELKSIRDTLHQEGIKCVFLKGLLLEKDVYQAPFTRATGDIDILVLRADIDRCIDILSRLSYKPQGSTYSFDDEDCQHTVPLSNHHPNKLKQFVVELHYYPHYKPWHCEKYGLKDVAFSKHCLQQAREITIEEERFFVLNISEANICLCSHFLHHLFDDFTDYVRFNKHRDFPLMKFVLDILLFLKKYGLTTSMLAYAKAIGEYDTVLLSLHILGFFVPELSAFAQTEPPQTPRRIVSETLQYFKRPNNRDNWINNKFFQDFSDFFASVYLGSEEVTIEIVPAFSANGWCSQAIYKQEEANWLTFKYQLQASLTHLRLQIELAGKDINIGKNDMAWYKKFHGSIFFYTNENNIQKPRLTQFYITLSEAESNGQRGYLYHVDRKDICFEIDVAHSNRGYTLLIDIPMTAIGANPIPGNHLWYYFSLTNVNAQSVIVVEEPMIPNAYCVYEYNVLRFA